MFFKDYHFLSDSSEYTSLYIYRNRFIGIPNLRVFFIRQNSRFGNPNLLPVSGDFQCATEMPLLVVPRLCEAVINASTCVGKHWLLSTAGIVKPGQGGLGGCRDLDTILAPSFLNANLPFNQSSICNLMFMTKKTLKKTCLLECAPI